MFYRRYNNLIMSNYEKITISIWPILWIIFKWSVIVYLIFEIGSCTMGAYFSLSDALRASAP